MRIEPLFIVLNLLLFIGPAFGHPVAVSPAVPQGQSVPISLLGYATDEHPGSAGLNRASSYLVRVAVPKGATPDVAVGRSVPVTLPIIHHQQTTGSVVKIEEGEVQLRLAQQVQELNGQRVRVQLPIAGKGIFRVPFTAIYSPRGGSKQVFVVKEGRAEARPAELVSLFSSDQVLVAAALNEGDQVVSQGIDNLISGDTVEVIPQAAKSEGASK